MQIYHSHLCFFTFHRILCFLFSYRISCLGSRPNCVQLVYQMEWNDFSAARTEHVCGDKSIWINKHGVQTLDGLRDAARTIFHCLSISQATPAETLLSIIHIYNVENQSLCTFIAENIQYSSFFALLRRRECMEPEIRTCSSAEIVCPNRINYAWGCNMCAICAVNDPLFDHQLVLFFA